jgi:hypothetical protein
MIKGVGISVLGLGFRAQGSRTGLMVKGLRLRV